MSRELTKPNNRLQGDRSSSCDWPEISKDSKQGFLVIRDPWGILSVEATNQWLVRVLVYLLECCPENILSFCLLDDEGCASLLFSTRHRRRTLSWSRRVQNRGTDHCLGRYKTKVLLSHER